MARWKSNKITPDIDLSTVTGVPVGTADGTGGYAIGRVEKNAPPELWIAVNLEGVGASVSIEPWFFLPELSGGVWLQVAEIPDIPLPGDTMEDKSLILSLQCPPMASRVYIRRTEVNNAPTLQVVTVWQAQENERK